MGVFQSGFNIRQRIIQNDPPPVRVPSASFYTFHASPPSKIIKIIRHAEDKSDTANAGRNAPYPENHPVPYPSESCDPSPTANTQMLINSENPTVDTFARGKDEKIMIASKIRQPVHPHAISEKIIAGRPKAPRQVLS